MIEQIRDDHPCTHRGISHAEDRESSQRSGAVGEPVKRRIQEGTAGRSAASAPSTESPNITTARAMPPRQIHPRGIQMTATATDATVPATVTMFGVTPMRASTRASVNTALVIDRPWLPVQPLRSGGSRARPQVVRTPSCAMMGGSSHPRPPGHDVLVKVKGTPATSPWFMPRLGCNPATRG